ncbi:MAG TPA: NAD(P)-dependent oxidoreductase [Dehalococcoidia bacterium]|nr:NAD(P)-dependent oxidoreductase [Chloroflexota bacterium]HCE76115.1 NAD(P)-dependent oxidoreductase [Dehalococcoidia bacterium]|tara:strand:- start:1003 stop:1731 length:729 start_codon:yes stop_codon:yes gene_type:complete
MTLKGQNVFITAAGQGIGRAITERFIQEGANVTATDIDLSLLKDLAGGTTYELDVTNKQKVQSSIREINPDVLVNCAGFVHNGTVMDASDEEFTFAMNLNVRSMFYTIQAVIPGMKSKGKGSIINIASVVSSVMAAPNRFLYSTSKAAVIGLTKSVARDFVTSGIRCNCICPGTVNTPSLRQRLSDTGDYEKALADFTARQPMGRIASANEIASLAMYLASDESTFTTGQAHVIDGGWANGS